MTVVAETESATRSLQQRVRGSIIAPGEPGWDAAPQAYNLAFTQSPELVALPENVRDVAAIVRFAAAHGLQVAPQRTGHNAEPLGDMDDVILLRTDRLRGVQIDAERRVARVRAGSKWADVVPQASELGLAALHGSTPDVSVAGYSLGGGIGWYARKLGLSTNSVTAIELVTADGQLRRVDHENEPELFWALRGGGGNFGVVTALEVQLYDIPEIYAGAFFVPFGRSWEGLGTWLEWTRTVPEELTSVGRVLQFPPIPEIPEHLRGQSFALVEAVFMGSEGDGAELLEPLRALGPAVDTFAMVSPVGISELHMDPPDPVPYTGDGLMLGDLDAAAIEAFVRAAGPASGSPLVSVEIRHVCGALHRADEGNGALATFDAEYLTFGVGAVMDAESYAANRRQLSILRDALDPYGTGRQYLNFTDEAGADPAGFYRADAYRRLRAVKAAVDPGNVFRANHPIPGA